MSISRPARVKSVGFGAMRCATWVGVCLIGVGMLIDRSFAQDRPAAQAAAPSPTEPQGIGGPLLVRRLTESQYRAIVADIFGADIPVVGRFEHGLRAEGLLAVGTSQAGVSSFSLEQYDVSAHGIAAAALSPEHRGQLVSCRPRSPGRFDAACAKQFVQHYGLVL